MTYDEVDRAMLGIKDDKEYYFLFKDSETKHLPDDVVEFLSGKNLTIRQAEIVLEIAKCRLKQTII